MIAIQRRGLFAHLALLLLLLIGLGLFGYLVMISLPDSKSAAERYLMVAVLCGVVALFGTGILYRRSRNLDFTLARARQRVRQGGFVATDYFRGAHLGGLGEMLAEIFTGVEEVSAKKSLRIGALNSLNALLLKQSPERLLVTNGEGIVFQGSSAFFEAAEASQGQIVGKNVSEILPELDFDRATNHFYREGEAFMVGSDEERVTAFPVLDAQRNLAYSVILVGAKAEVRELQDGGEEEDPAERDKKRTKRWPSLNSLWKRDKNSS